MDKKIAFNTKIDFAQMLKFREFISVTYAQNGMMKNFKK